MPSSRPDCLSKLCNDILTLRPQSILDIGCGFGSRGCLFREYLETWENHYFKTSWTHRIDCVEAYSSYITDLHRYIYDNIYQDNILNIIDKLDMKYSLAFLGDVLEHFVKEEGLELINKLKYKANNIIVITPIKVSEQNDVFGNEFERHKSQYSTTDFPNSEVEYFGNAQYIKIKGN